MGGSAFMDRFQVDLQFLWEDGSMAFTADGSGALRRLAPGEDRTVLVHDAAAARKFGDAVLIEKTSMRAMPPSQGNGRGKWIKMMGVSVYPCRSQPASCRVSRGKGAWRVAS